MKRRGRPPLLVRPIKPLSRRVVIRLIRVMGNARYGYRVEVNGLMGVVDIPTDSRAFADHMCRSMRRFVKKLTPEAQRRAFDPVALAHAEGEPR